MYNNNNNYNDNYTQSSVFGQTELSVYFAKVFGWMFLGLFATAAAAYFTANSDFLMGIVYSNIFVFFGIMIAEIALVVYLSARITKIQYSTAVFVFLLYAVLNGITFSVILLIYTQTSIASTFMITALTFGAMSLYGYVTKTDLSRFRNILFMGLIGLIILSLVNIFLRSDTASWIISILGLFVFLGLTAYDTQKIKQLYYATQNNLELQRKVAIRGALSLYLDFINLFLILLRLFGRRR